MLRALGTASTGMQAQETRVDVIANNLANVNTTGFKKSRTEFQDLLYETIRPAGAAGADGGQTPAPLQVGHGARPVATLREHTPGGLRETGNPLDLAIEGNGFFQVRSPSGEIAYSRDGSFRTDSEGRLVNSEGSLVEPAIVLPADTQQISISSDGVVSVTQSGDTNSVQVGQFELASFANPVGLEAKGHNLYVPTAASGEAIQATPGSEGMGTVVGGFVEISNVRVVEEMVELITSQRAYETNSRVVRAADDMLQATVNLR